MLSKCGPLTQITDLCQHLSDWRCGNSVAGHRLYNVQRRVAACWPRHRHAPGRLSSDIATLPVLRPPHTTSLLTFYYEPSFQLTQLYNLWTTSWNADFLVYFLSAVFS